MDEFDSIGSPIGLFPDLPVPLDSPFDHLPLLFDLEADVALYAFILIHCNLLVEQIIVHLFYLHCATHVVVVFVWVDPVKAVEILLVLPRLLPESLQLNKEISNVLAIKGLNLGRHFAALHVQVFEQDFLLLDELIYLLRAVLTPPPFQDEVVDFLDLQLYLLLVTDYLCQPIVPHEILQIYCIDQLMNKDKLINQTFPQGPTSTFTYLLSSNSYSQISFSSYAYGFAYPYPEGFFFASSLGVSFFAGETSSFGYYYLYSSKASSYSQNFYSCGSIFDPTLSTLSYLCYQINLFIFSFDLLDLIVFLFLELFKAQLLFDTSIYFFQSRSDFFLFCFISLSCFGFLYVNASGLFRWSQNQRVLLMRQSVSLAWSYFNFLISFSGSPLQSCSRKTMASSFGTSIIFKLLLLLSPVIFKNPWVNSILMRNLQPSITLVFCMLMSQILCWIDRQLVMPLLWTSLDLKVARQNSMLDMRFITLLLSFQSLLSFYKFRVGFLFWRRLRNRLFYSVMLSSCCFRKIQFRLLFARVLMFLLLLTEYAPFLLITLEILSSSTRFSRSISISLTSLIFSRLLLLMMMVSLCSMSLEVMGFIYFMLRLWQVSVISCSFCLMNLLRQGRVRFIGRLIKLLFLSLITLQYQVEYMMILTLLEP